MNLADLPPLPAQEPERLDRIAVEYATEQMLADVDGIADWLGAQCYGKDRVTSEYECRHDKLPDASVATLLHAALVNADRGDAELCIRAMRLLVARYLRDHDDQLKRLAAEAMSN